MQTDKKEAMPNISDQWERLSAVIEQAQMSPNYFARYIGLPCGENIYRIKRGQNGISRDVADRVIAKFPNISKGWLMTGEGQMYANEQYETAPIPLYDSNVEAALNGSFVTPVCHIQLPVALRDCDIAVKLEDDPQTILLLAKIEKDEMKEEREYVFLIKKTLYLHKWNRNSEINPGKFDKIYAVRGRLTIYAE